MSGFGADYTGEYHKYPVYSQQMASEGALKRFRPLPGIKEVFDYALLGLPTHLPMTNQQLTPEIVAPYLESAITEIEMDLDCNISEVTHFFPCDYVDGMFTSNFNGIILNRWPVTQIIQVALKYPHTNTNQIYQKYTIPPAWIYLFKNKLNIVAAFGRINASIESPELASAGGLFSYISGFGRGPYQPGMIEVTYKAGFEHDKLPALVADLVKTWAAINFLADVAPVLFPNQSVNVSIDSISQGVSYSIQQLLQEKLKHMEQKKNDLKRNFKKGFSKTIIASFVGA